MKWILTVALLGLGLASCGQVCDTDLVASTPGPEFSALHNGGRGHLGAADVAKITLDTNTTTPLAWVQSAGFDNFEVLHRADRVGTCLGCPGQVTMFVVATQAGTAEVELTYRSIAPDENLPMAGEKQTYKLTLTADKAYEGDFQAPQAVAPAPQAEPTPVGLPPSYSYCTASTCPTIKNQGNCGSCWAFASIGTVEAVVKKQKGSYTRLSDQHLVSCNTSGYSCNGGLQGFPWYYNTADKGGKIGTVYESDFPYTATSATCKTSVAHHDKLSSWTAITQGQASTATLKQAMLEHGLLQTN